MIQKGLWPGFALLAMLAGNMAAQTPATTDAPATPAKLARHRHAPAQIRGRRPDNTVESTNWSGYAVTGSEFTDVKGSWVVPSVNCGVTPGTKSSPTYSSFWVGIDGYSSSTVEQIGTDSDCDGGAGNPGTYYAWYEFYPAFPVNLSLTISPGDTISAEVNYSGSEFTVTITDLTTGKSFSKSESVRKAKRASAEWIAEAPCCARGGNSLPLSDFSAVSFGTKSYVNANYPNEDGSYPNEAADSSTNGSIPISSFGVPPTVEQINMVTSSGAPEANTSSVSLDGISSFTVTWASE